MEKNVSSVDLEELLKAREALDAERGVETDPNLYNGYNPNRENSSEEQKTESLENVNDYNNITDNSNVNDTETPKADEILNESVNDPDINSSFDTENESANENSEDVSHDEHLFNDDVVKDEQVYEEHTSQNQTESSENYGTSQSNLAKFDIFSAFEVKENVPVQSSSEVVEKPLQTDLSDENVSTIKDDILSENKISDEELESKLEKIDNVEELENLLSDLLADIDDEIEEIEEDEKINPIENIYGTLDDVSTKEEDVLDENSLVNNTETESIKEEKDEINIDTQNEDTSFLTAIDIEPKFDEDITVENNSDADKKALEDDVSENILEVKEDVIPLTNSSLEHLAVEPEGEELSKDEVTREDIDSLILDLFNDEEESDSDEPELMQNNEEVKDTKTEELNENLELDETSDKVIDNDIEKQEELTKDDEIVETSENADDEVLESSEESENKDDEIAETSENTDDEVLESSEGEENTIEESESEEEIASELEEQHEENVEESKKTIDKVQDLNEDYITSLLNRTIAPETMPTTQTKTVYAENSAPEEDVEVITDYSQLRDILQKQLKETVEIDESEFQKKYSFKEIEDFKFIDEIASDDFKAADKFSYILGKNENNEMIYGNFKEHCNLAVFGKTDSVINSFLNSMILSLCLKNSIHDVNFVLLDSDINSPFEVYNKSSYLYFNRIAKTNKEILDTLIEVSKEVDKRYSKFASLGVKNIDTYNEVAVENKIETMPYVILVFNNYTAASQATDHDRINACLYQILKYGRISGIYAVVAAKLPIDVNQINYSLSSRISFKSDEDSTYTVGAEGVEFLPSDNDAMYYNISSNKTEHVKVANVTEIELDLIIKDLEE